MSESRAIWWRRLRGSPEPNDRLLGTVWIDPQFDRRAARAGGVRATYPLDCESVPKVSISDGSCLSQDAELRCRFASAKRASLASISCSIGEREPCPSLRNFTR